MMIWNNDNQNKKKIPAKSTSEWANERANERVKILYEKFKWERVKMANGCSVLSLFFLCLMNRLEFLSLCARPVFLPMFVTQKGNFMVH